MLKHTVYKVKGSIRDSLIDAIREFSREHPRLYEKHSRYFNMLTRIASRIKPPVSICWRNQMSKKTYMCVIVDNDTIIVDRFTPQEVMSTSKKIIVAEKEVDLLTTD